MREAFEGRVDELVSSEPSKMAGAKGNPQAFSRGGPELSGVKGMSPSSIFKPGKQGFEARGWDESKSSFESGNKVIHSLV